MARDDSNEGYPCEICGRVYVPQRMEKCPYCYIAELEAIVAKEAKEQDDART